MDKTGMEQQFMQTFDEFADAIFRFCMVKVSHVEQAEDMTQEVFMRYWQYLRNGKEMTNTRSLLYTIANNLAKDWYKRKKATSLDEQMEDGQEPPAETRLSGEAEAVYREVVSVIEDMEENDRTVLLLRYVEGLEPRDIAEVLGESSNVISVRINRAEKRLRAKFEYE